MLYDKEPPARALTRTWTAAGPSPAFHERAKDAVREAFPLLAHHLERLAKETIRRKEPVPDGIDISRYLTDDMIHVALRASDSANEGGVVGGRERMMRAALSAALPDIIQQAKAEALHAAADDMNARMNSRRLIANADKWGGYYAGVRDAIGMEEQGLRARAALIWQGAQP